MQTDWKARGMACVDMGIGINTGMMLFGNMGSKHRYNFTVIGDSVNLASRLEGTNRQFGTNIIISEATLLQVKDQVVVRELDLIRVRGKQHPVKVYELLGLAGDFPQSSDLIARFAKGLEAYRSGQWKTAIEIFEALARDHPQDAPSHVFLKRCHDLLEQPPKGSWDGVFVMRGN
jgi:adenylate cyclase